MVARINKAEMLAEVSLLDGLVRGSPALHEGDTEGKELRELAVRRMRELTRALLGSPSSAPGADAADAMAKVREVLDADTDDGALEELGAILGENASLRAIVELACHALDVEFPGPGDPLDPESLDDQVPDDLSYALMRLGVPAERVGRGLCEGDPAEHKPSPAALAAYNAIVADIADVPALRRAYQKILGRDREEIRARWLKRIDQSICDNAPAGAGK
jgi:hypothetical protein